MGINNYQSDYLTGEKYVLEHYLKNISKPLIIDIGAHIGDSAILVKTINSRSRVYSFEPNPSTYMELSRNSRKYRFHAYNFALGDKEGTMTLYDTANGYSSPFASVYKSVVETVHHTKTNKYKIKITTLDKFYENNLTGQSIDLLKIDVEGYEYKVLLGAKKLIGSGKVNLIQFEFNIMNRHSKIFFLDFEKLLKGYTLYRLLPHGLLPINSDSLLYSEIFMFQNILAIRKK
jgi:FkbM family methyltransferase